MKRKLLFLALGVTLAIAIGITSGSKMVDDSASEIVNFDTRGIFPPETPQPTTWRPGIINVRDNVNYSVSTPRPNQVGTHIEVRPTTVQSSVGAAYNWSAVETKVAQAANRGLDSWLSVAIADRARGGTPDPVYGPSGWPTIQYDDGCGNIETALDYRTLATPYAKFVDAITTKFNSDNNVAGYVFGAGHAEEVVNAYQFGSDCATKRQNLEKIITCKQYIDWVKYGAIIWAERTDKPVTLSSGGLGACVDSYANTWEKNTQLIFDSLWRPTQVPGGTPIPYTYITPTPVYGIVYRSNGLHLAGDEWNWGTTSNYYGRLNAGVRAAELSGAAYEFGGTGFSLPSGCEDGFPCAIPTDMRVGYTSDAAIQSVASGAINLFWQCDSVQGCWQDYLNPTALKVITQTMGMNWNNSTAAWVRFGDATIPRQGNRSSMPWPITFLATVKTSEEPYRFCEPSVRATAQAISSSYATPVVCQFEITDPVAPESRNTLYFNSGSVISINVDDRWRYAKSSNLKLRIVYLDRYNSKIEVGWNTATGSDKLTISLGDTNAWKTTDIMVNNASFRNGFENNGDIKIIADGDIYLYFASVECTTCTSSTPTPGPTNTPTFTPIPGNVNVVNVHKPMFTTTISNPAYSYSSFGNQMRVGWNGSPKQAILIKFADMQMPTGSTEIRNAILKLRIVGSNNVNKEYPIRASKILKYFSKSSDWKSTGVENWNTAGAQGKNQDYTEYGQKTVIAKRLPNGDPTIFDIDITDIVKSWNTEEGEEPGIILNLNSTCASGCDDWIAFANESHEILEYRPKLEVLFAYNQTPTPTRTPTMTSTRVSTPVSMITPTRTPTPTGTRVSTPTPISGLIINEICSDPITDNNLDGSVNKDDRAIELLNWTDQEIDLGGHLLKFDNSYSKAYFIPNNTIVYPYSYKIIYSYQLKNIVGENFIMPGGTDLDSATVELYNDDGVLIDGKTWTKIISGMCWGRSPNGNSTWAYNMYQTLGKPNGTN